ncbi:MAG: Coq4 family protein [Chitinophagaceae bacterium]
MKGFLIRGRSIVLIFLTHQVALPILKIVRKPNVFNYNKEDLKKFPSGSLGNDLYWFLEKRNLPLLKHYARHDLKHVLLNYDTTDTGEAMLQCFMLGNGRISFPVLATVMYSLLTMPEYWKRMRSAFRKGRNSISIHNWQWNEVIKEQTIQLRNKMFDHSIK